MKEYIIDHPFTSFLIRIRNAFLSSLYLYILKPILFQFDPEKVHDVFISAGDFLGKYSITKGFVHVFFSYSHDRLKQTVNGIVFPNPIGLAAGFDKNARIVNIIPSIGFGFEEVGSITGKPCEGNPKPRLWRLKKSKSILVYYGLVNDGAPKIARRLQSKSFDIPVGTSIAKTNSCETVTEEGGIADYVKGFRRFVSIGDYYTINISCPNAHGGQPFHDPRLLEILFGKLDSIETTKPIFLKISPDLTLKQVDDIITVSNHHRIHGFIIANATKKRDNSRVIDPFPSKNGGMTGKVVEGLADELISYVYKQTHGKYTIIGCGGVFTAEDAYKKIKKGASLIQLITGLIFNGPTVVSEINEGLVRLMKRDGYTNISEAIGVESR